MQLNTSDPLAVTPAPRSMFGILAGGIVTSMASLAAVLTLEGWCGFNPMGFSTMHGLLPLGSLLVGMAAGSGYMLMCCWTGHKISKRLLWTIAALQLLTFFAAHYALFRFRDLHYTNTGQAVGFWAYLDFMIRNTVLRDGSTTNPMPLGIWGYGLRALEVAGFIGGGVVMPLSLKYRPYCEACELYMKSRRLAHLPSGAVIRKVSKKNVEAMHAFIQEDQAAAQAAGAQTELILKAAQAEDMVSVIQAIRSRTISAKQTKNLVRHVRMELAQCPCCGSGLIRALHFVPLKSRGLPQKVDEVRLTLATIQALELQLQAPIAATPSPRMK